MADTRYVVFCVDSQRCADKLAGMISMTTDKVACAAYATYADTDSPSVLKSVGRINWNIMHNEALSATTMSCIPYELTQKTAPAAINSSSVSLRGREVQRQIRRRPTARVRKTVRWKCPIARLLSSRIRVICGDNKLLH